MVVCLARHGAGVPPEEGQRSRDKIKGKGQVAPPLWIGHEQVSPPGRYVML